MKVLLLTTGLLFSLKMISQNYKSLINNIATDSIQWIQVKTDSGIIHAAVAIPNGKGPFPALIILHGTHGFAEEYVQMASTVAKNGIVGIAACWFAGHKGEGTRFIIPIDCDSGPPFIDVAGIDRFRISRHTIDSLIGAVKKNPIVQSEHLFLFGHSRGAGASLDYVLSHPGKVQGLILNSCGYPAEVIKRAKEIKASVLILHGTSDGAADGAADGGSAVTNIDMARQFEAALKTTNKNVETKYYEGSGHNAIFSDKPQREDSMKRIVDFIQNKQPK